MKKDWFSTVLVSLLLVVLLGNAPVQAAELVLRPDAAAFISMAAGIMLVPWDQGVYQGIHELPGSNSVAWKGISLAGDPALAAAAALTLAASGSEFGRDLSRALLWNGLATLGIKTLTGMARPEMGTGPVMTGPTVRDEYGAFPSAHPSSAFAAATVIAHHYPEHAKWAYLAAALVGLSRIFVEAHWPSNVVFGAGLGCISAQVALDWR